MNNLIASESRIGIVPPLFIDVMSIARLVGPENKKLKSLQEKNTQKRGKIWMTDTTCGYPSVLWGGLVPILYIHRGCSKNRSAVRTYVCGLIAA